MKASEVLAKALEEIDEANVPAELRAVAFEKAVDLVLADAGLSSEQMPQPLGRGASDPIGGSSRALSRRLSRRLLEAQGRPPGRSRYLRLRRAGTPGHHQPKEAG
jgi:DNA-binding phage protein